MDKYNITGMSCAACSARIEKAVSKVEGVSSCSVNLLTNSMGVEGAATSDAIIKAVVDAGYGASLETSSVSSQKTVNQGKTEAEPLADTETPKLIKRLCWSIGFVLVLMYFSMGHMMWNWPLPHFFDNNHVAMGLVQMLLAMIVMIINQKFFVNGFKGLLHGSPNMDTLVALGSSASFIWSTVSLFSMTAAQVEGDSHKLMALMMNLYFESAAMILALITVGKTLESYSKGKTTNALKSLMKLAPKTAVLEKNGQEIEVGIEQVNVGDVFIVRPGAQIPVDGLVIEGTSAIDESALTGESIPVDKEAGSVVSAGTVNQSGFLKCKASKVGNDTTLSQIIQMVSDAAATKAPIAKIADKVSGVFVPAVIGIAVLTMIIWLIVGQDFSFALARGISVLVISCPCALGLATPVAIMVGNGLGARNGILFKTAVSLEETGKTQIVVLDKTGTITMGNPVVTDIIYFDGRAGNFVSVGLSEVPEAKLPPLLDATPAAPLQSLTQSALDIEKKSEHPLAKAVVQFAEAKGYCAQDVENFESFGGRGIQALKKISENENFKLLAGNIEFILKNCTIFQNETALLKEKIEELALSGKTPLIFARKNLTSENANDEILGIIAVADSIKPDSKNAIEEMEALGLTVVMLTGDNSKTAHAIADQAGIKNVIAGVLPDQKAQVVEKLKAYGKVAMVGDGINDAPSLTVADMGIAIGSGADVAIDAADVVLMHSSLKDVCAAIRLSRKTLVNIKENLFWAFIYNVIGIPLAAGAFVKLFGWELKPMFGAAAMSLSSFCVVSNALRLNLANIRKPLKTVSKSNLVLDLSDLGIQEEIMTRKIRIDGMMCGHCEAHVKKALEALDGVETAVVSHTEGNAIITTTAPVANDLLVKTVADAGYSVISIEG